MYHVLIVEDNLIQLNALATILGNHRTDICIHKASNYQSAVECLKQNRFHIFLLDIALDAYHNEKDGVELGQYIRSFPEYETTPILYITSIMDKAIEVLNSTHCYGYITKPYTPTDITQMIDSMLNMPHTQKQLFEFKGLHNIHYQIQTDDIIFIDTYNHLVTLHTTHETYETRSYTLNSLLELLPDYFIQCHKSFAVNKKHVRNYDKGEQIIYLNGRDDKILVGRKYKNCL